MQLSDILLGMHCAVKIGAARARVIVDAIREPEGTRTWHLVAVRRPGSSRILKEVRVNEIHEIGAHLIPGGENCEPIINAPSTEQSRANLRQSNFPIALERVKRDTRPYGISK